MMVKFTHTQKIHPLERFPNDLNFLPSVGATVESIHDWHGWRLQMEVIKILWIYTPSGYYPEIKLGISPEPYKHYRKVVGL